MPKAERTSKEILEDTLRTLKTAEAGYRTLAYGSPKDKVSGLMNLVVFGRSVTNVLQNLRATEPKFDTWYKPYVDEMAKNELFKYFYDLRSSILKEGRLRVSTAVHINQLSFPEDMARLPKPPPFLKVKGFFIGDNLGGSGYEILLPDGSIEKYYIELPDEIGRAELILHDAPGVVGDDLFSSSAVELSRNYLGYIGKMVKDACIVFSEKTK
jgi:hypothetical protein